MKQISILAPAKINLYLNVAGKRPDGYHDIESVMQTVSLFDCLHMTIREETDDQIITLTSVGVSIPLGENNLIYRAVKAFLEEMNIERYEITVSIEKNIPTEAGLGGGSSDAAATLLALNDLYDTRLSIDELCRIGVKLGADIPFCIKKGTVITKGIGEIMQPCTPMPDCYLLIAMPKGGKVSTAEAYRRIDALGTDADIVFADFLNVMKNSELSDIAAKLYNQFELITPKETGSASLVETIRSLGAAGARMSGSGAAVFGIFTDEASVQNAYDSLPCDMVKYICRPISAEYPYILS